MTRPKIELTMSLPFTMVNGELSDADVIELVINASQSSKLSDRLSGTVIDSKYQVRSLLGEGGMGSVFSVVHVLLHKEMALKTFRTSDLSAEAWQRFQREAQAIGRLVHPNIVQVFDFGISEQNFPYYTMELLKGESLFDRLERGDRMPESEVINMFVQVADALAHAHRQGIVHRDIKPANIFLSTTPNGALPKVVDFGLAKLASQNREAQSLTATGMVFGSPLYMSPEQSRGKETDSRTDIYSFGCTLFDALAGTPPFAGDSPVELITKHQKEKAPSLKEACPEGRFPDGLEEIMARLLAKEPADRYQDFEEVAYALSLTLGDKTATRPVPKSKTAPVPLTPLPRSSGGVRRPVSESARETGVERIETSKPAEGGDFKRAVLITAAVLLVTMIGATALIKSGHVAAPNMVAIPAASPIQQTGDLEFFSRGFKDGYNIFEFPGFSDSLGRISWEGQDEIPAAGTIKVPAGAQVHFIAGPLVALHPELLRRFKPDDLSDLKLPAEQRWTSEIFAELENLKMLQGLDVSGTPLQPIHMQSINKLTNLLRLDVSHTQIGGADLTDLPTLRKLNTLAVNQLTDMVPLLAQLRNSQDLTKLSLIMCGLTDEDLKDIATMSSLRELSVDFNSFTIEGLKYLTALNNLEVLEMQSSDVGPESISIIKSFTHLRALRMQTMPWPKEDQEKLKKALPADCKLEDVL